MIKLKSKKDCTGCTACQAACGHNAIDMVADKEGFSFPRVDTNLCVDCGLCERVCPVINTSEEKVPREVVVGQNKNNDILYRSSSGGVFSALAESVLNRRGKVYGAVIDYDDNFKIRHTGISDTADLDRLRGSKYVQSDLTGVFRQVRDDLISGNEVLFVGTPCQVSGLKKYLRTDYDNLLTVDLICHGVPSPKVWQQFISELLEKSSGSSDKQVKQISFRDKRYGWQGYGLSILFSNQTGDVDNTMLSHFYKCCESPYMNGFLCNLFLRDSCTACPSKGFSSGADITLGDAWGIDNYIEFPTLDKGMSVAIALTEKGGTALENLPIHWLKSDDKLLRMHNAAVYNSVKHNNKRQKFFKLLEAGNSVESAVSLCFPPPTFMEKVIWSIKRRLPQH